MYDAQIPIVWQKVRFRDEICLCAKNEHFVRNLDFLEVVYAWFLVYRAIGTRRPISQLVFRRTTERLLDDRLFQSTGFPYGNATGI